MKTPMDILIKPYVTEKSNTEIASGKYTFIVDVSSTKTEIKSAVERLFNVKVLKVNVMNYEGKNKRMGVHQGKRADWKKAIVKIDLQPGTDIYKVKGGKEVTANKKYKTNIEEFGAVN